MNREEIGGCLVGEVRPTLDDIYELYCQHATIVAQGERNTGKKKGEHEVMIEESTSTKVKM
ncbi:sn-glycerol-3-phosphate import ATP-binding protein UgpC [Bienertia sinuspersici]